MKPGKTIEQFKDELVSQSTQKKDYLIDTRRLVMDADNNGVVLTMLNDNEETTNILGMNDIAHSQVSQHLGIPYRYYEKMRMENPALLAENVNAWFNTEPDVRMVRSLGGTARAFLSKRYRRIDNIDIANIVVPMIGNVSGISFESCEITESKMYIKAVNKRLTREVRPGDFVQSGIIVTNSEVGLGTVTIQPLLYRLVCTNGMVVNDMHNATRRRHIGQGNLADENYELYASDTLLADDHALMLKMRDTIKSALDEVHFGNLVQNMQAAADVRITSNEIPKMIELTGTDFGFTKNEAEGILNHLIREGDLTLYGLSNAVTRFAQDVDSYDRSTELEGIGYNILTMPERTWNRLNAA